MKYNIKCNHKTFWRVFYFPVPNIRAKTTFCQRKRAYLLPNPTRKIQEWCNP